MSLELVEIHIPNRFQPFTIGKKIIFAKPGKISEILEEIIETYPDLAGKIVNDKKEIKWGHLLFKNGENRKQFISNDEDIVAGQKITLVIAPGGG